MHDIFGPGSNLEGRVFNNYDELFKIVDHCKGIGLKIVLTSGTYDLLHIGHSRYLEEAKKHGDVLIIGVDSDDKVQSRKGPHRPIVGEKERLEILCHCRHVDLVFLKDKDVKRWHLIETVRPDVLIVTDRVYTEEDLNSLRELDYCGNIIMLKSQATTSTTARIRAILVDPAEKIKSKLKDVIAEVCSFLDTLTGRDEGDNN